MPYIEKKDRKLYDYMIDEIMDDIKDEGLKKGHLNYCITKLILEYTKKKGICYDTLSDVTGVLNDVKTEYERELVAKYEDDKIKKNGKIY